MLIFFFFQAEDGIRDYKVTGVQTCALPISPAFDEDAVHHRLGPYDEVVLIGHSVEVFPGRGRPRADRKSTRLNSSHLVISYAVFCLKKKKSQKWKDHLPYAVLQYAYATQVF